MFKKILNILFAGALILLSSCAPATQPVTTAGTVAATEPPAPSETPEPIHIKVGILNFMSNSPLFIAQEEGYFAEQGLEVEFVNFGTSERDMIPGLMQGQLDVGTVAVGTSTLNGIAQGSNARYVADKGFINPEASCSTDGWVVRSDLLEAGALDTLAGLKGLNFTFSTGNTLEYAADLLLQNAELTRDDIQILDIRDQATRIEALGNGSLDITVTGEPWITRAQQAGVADLWLPLSELIPNYSIGTILFSPSMLERDREVGVRFMTAYLKAIQQFNQGKTDRNVEIIAGYTQLSPEEIKAICWPSYQPDGKIYTQGLMDFQQWAFEMDYIDTPLEIEQIWDPQFVDAANAILNK